MEAAILALALTALIECVAASEAAPGGNLIEGDAVMERADWEKEDTLYKNMPEGCSLRMRSLVNAMPVPLANGYLYVHYADAKDYKIYLVRRELSENGLEEIVGKCIYDSENGKVGKPEFHTKKIYSAVKPDVMMGRIDIKRPSVDAQFAGAEEINRILAVYEDGVMEYIDIIAEEGGWKEYSSSFSEISYFDGRCFSFCQEEYKYTSTEPHGNTYWIGFTFDLNTGKRLDLSDIIENNELELKEIVTGHFAESINKNPERFWGGALETVMERTGYRSPFYLSENGIHFYFHPYELAAYAAGFQEVVIPYSEFEMKIEVGE